jgi:hypothetical protein
MVYFGLQSRAVRDVYEHGSSSGSFRAQEVVVDRKWLSIYNMLRDIFWDLVCVPECFDSQLKVKRFQPFKAPPIPSDVKDLVIRYREFDHLPKISIVPPSASHCPLSLDTTKPPSFRVEGGPHKALVSNAFHRRALEVAAAKAVEKIICNPPPPARVHLPLLLLSLRLCVVNH